MTDAEMLAQLNTAIENHPGAATSIQEGDKRTDFVEYQKLVAQRDAVQAKIAAAAGTFNRRTIVSFRGGS